MKTQKLIGCVGHDCDGCKKQKRDMRNLKTNLKALTDQVLRHLVWLDEEMAKHESPERGKRLAAMANVLDMVNDAARYHALGIDFRKDDKNKERARVMRSNAGDKPPQVGIDCPVIGLEQTQERNDGPKRIQTDPMPARMG